MEITRLLAGAGVIDTGAALVHAARDGQVAIAKFLLQQHKRNKKARLTYMNTRYHRSGRTALMSCICGAYPRVARCLVDAGADTKSAVPATELTDGEVIYHEAPSGLTDFFLREKIAADMSATKELLNNLRAIRRLLLQAEAVHAVSWLWLRGNDASSSSITPTTAGCRGLE